MKLSAMKNIGPKLENDLIAVGICSSDDLVRVGSIYAAKKLNSCANQLYALEGAIQGVRWHSLDKNHREALLVEYKETI